jgi:hypothetical protein
MFADAKVVAHLENLDMHNPETIELLQRAQEADLADSQLTIKQALRKYPKAVAFAMLLSCALIMEGYDVVTVSRKVEGGLVTRLVTIHRSIRSTASLNSESNSVPSAIPTVPCLSQVGLVQLLIPLWRGVGCCIQASSSEKVANADVEQLLGKAD